MSGVGSGVELDLLVVGGGPAGLATALFLGALEPARAGRIAVLEKALYPRDKICAGAVGARADRALAAIGVRVDVPSAPIDTIAVAARAGALVRRDPRGAARGRVVRRAEFDQALALVARERGVRVHDGVRVAGLDVRADRVVVETSRGRIEARAVVGADGVGSFVRRALGLGAGALTAQVVEVDTPPVAGERDGETTLAFDLRDADLAGYAWDFPTPLGGALWRSRGVYGLRFEAPGASPAARGRGPSAAAPAAPTRVDDVSARLERRLEQLALPVHRASFRRFAERGLPLAGALAAPRVLLVGEAAGIDPALGEGIAQAILYGRVAAHYLARARSRGDYAFHDWRAELASTRLGFDLATRTRAAAWIFGPSAASRGLVRPVVERWVTSSTSIADAGLHYFGGERVPRAWLARAALDLARAAAREALRARRPTAIRLQTTASEMAREPEA